MRFFQTMSAFIIALVCTPASADEKSELLNLSGFYIGADLGVGSLETDFRSDFGLISPDTYKSSPKSGGVYVGYGREFGSVYVGVEGGFRAYGDTEVEDLSISMAGGGADSTEDGVGGSEGGIGGSATGPAVGGGIPGNCITPSCNQGRIHVAEMSAEAFNTRLQASGSLKARLGYSVGRILPFVSAGIAAGNIETNYLGITTKKYIRDDGAVLRETATGHSVDDQKFMVGYTLGGGAEFAINSRVSIRGEYVFTDLGNRVYEHSDPAGSESFKTRLHEGRIGISLHF